MDLEKRVRHVGVGLVFVVLAIFVWFKVIATPHVQDNQQVLERFSWTLKYKNHNHQTVRFTDKHMIINGTEYSYTLDDDDNFVITNGFLKGKYTMSDDTTDYVLKNKNVTLHLIR